jgi:hypothetical protein
MTATEMAAWYDDPAEVAATEAMLVRAGVLEIGFGGSWFGPWSPDGAPGGCAYYRSKPWKWSRERTIARILERTWEQAGIPVEEAWEMTGAEVMARMQEKDAKPLELR